MGWTQVRGTVVGNVSSHNSEQDKIDKSAWEEFWSRVEDISREHRYESLELDVNWNHG